MKTACFLSALVASLVLPACSGAPEDEETTQAFSEDAMRSALPITGEWALVEWQGHTSLQQGSEETLFRVRRRFDTPASRPLSRLELSPAGDGTIRGKETCRPELAPGSRVRELPPGHGGVVAAIEGLLQIIEYTHQLVETAHCEPNHAEEKTVVVYRRTNFWGQPSPSLDANLGVYGEGGKARAGDAECRTLRGVRWMRLTDGTSMCAGYTDGAATTVKMLVQRPGEIYVQRLVLKRPGSL